MGEFGDAVQPATASDGAERSGFVMFSEGALALWAQHASTGLSPKIVSPQYALYFTV
jgi:hypothetical protein